MRGYDGFTPLTLAPLRGGSASPSPSRGEGVKKSLSYFEPIWFTLPDDASPVICDSCRKTGSAGTGDFSHVGDLLEFTPVPRQGHRVDGWTAERQRRVHRRAGDHRLDAPGGEGAGDVASWHHQAAPGQGRRQLQRRLRPGDGDRRQERLAEGRAGRGRRCGPQRPRARWTTASGMDDETSSPSSKTSTANSSARCGRSARRASPARSSPPISICARSPSSRSRST